MYTKSYYVHITPTLPVSDIIDGVGELIEDFGGSIIDSIQSVDPLQIDMHYDSVGIVFGGQVIKTLNYSEAIKVSEQMVKKGYPMAQYWSWLCAASHLGLVCSIFYLVFQV